jgi:uncharacterized protein (TIGR02452 family)
MRENFMDKQSLARWAQGLVDAREGAAPQDMPDASTLACWDAQQPKLARSSPASSGAFHGVCSVHLDGTIERALALKSEGFDNVGVLVFCSAKRVGGGWRSGAFAQEEAVASCSTWGLDCFAPEFHQAPHADFFYSDQVLTLSGSILASSPGVWIDPPEPVFFAGFAAPNMKALRESGEAPSSREQSARTLEALTKRCKKTLGAFAEAGCSAVVLGAIGCGVFEIDPDLAAHAWSEALKTHGGSFAWVDFALSRQPSREIEKAFALLTRPAEALKSAPRLR